MDRAGVPTDQVARAWQAWLLIGSGSTVAAAVIGGPWLAGLALIVIAGVPLGLLHALRDRGANQAETVLPDLVEDIARRLRTGSSLPQALAGAAAPVATVHRHRRGDPTVDLAEVVAAVEQGAMLITELEAWAERRPRPAVALVVAALTLGVATGGPQARALDAVAATLRDRAAVRREATALAAQARASAAVMGFTPLVFAGLAVATDPRVGHVLVATPAGLACLAGGMALDAVAALWMLRITGTAA